MKKMKTLPYRLLGTLMVLATLLPLSASAMDSDDDTAGPSSPRSATSVKSLEVLAAEEVVRPYVTELKEVLLRSSALRQRIKQEEQDRKQEVQKQAEELAAQGQIGEAYSMLSSTGLSAFLPPFSLEPQNDPIYRTPAGADLYTELNTVLDKLLFVLDPETLQPEKYPHISPYHIQETLSRKDALILGLAEYKPTFIVVISSQLSSEEKSLLPVRHLVTNVIHTVCDTPGVKRYLSV